MNNGRLKIAVTQGDINGISYEVILKTLAEPRVYEQHAVVIYGSPKVAAYYKKNLELDFPITQVQSAENAEYGRVSIVNCNDEEVKVEAGHSTAMAGQASFQALEAAVRDLKAGLVDVLVTGPINKANIQSEHFHFPGHTEYLEQSFAENGQQALMLMVGESLRVAVATGHMPVDKVASSLSKDLIVRKVKALDQSLRRDFAIDCPRIAVLALNPHAGDNGLLGSQEADILIPAIEELQKENYCCFGPLSADGFFGSGQFSLYDGVLAMYHDQGLIPFKALSAGRGVNFTAGLPIVRTSPAHGTAYELAGQNQADEISFREALLMACDIYFNRKEYAEIHSNPLRRQRVESGDDTNDISASEA